MQTGQSLLTRLNSFLGLGDLCRKSGPARCFEHVRVLDVSPRMSRSIYICRISLILSRAVGEVLKGGIF